MHQDNLPKWDKTKNGFYEVWYLKLNLQQAGEPAPALWLRFTTLSLRTGLKKATELWGIFFDPKTAGAPSQKIAIKNTASPNAYEVKPDGSIWIEDSVFAENKTSGSIVSRGQRIEWDLHFEPNDFTFFHVPQILKKSKLSKSTVCKPNTNIQFNGWFKINDKRYEVKEAPGCQGHIWGTKYAKDWAWAHCNSFEGVDAKKSPVVFEALTARVKLANLITSPQMSALFLEYKGKRYELNRLMESFSIRSKYDLTSWRLEADQGPLRVIAEISCDVKDLAGITYEDTEGLFLHCKNSELASMTLSIYLNGKLETTLRSRQTTGFETVSRERSPYVEVLL